jgi:NDP-sugar pyrophosphorylase family protein
MKDIQLVIPMAGSSKMFTDAGFHGPKWMIDIDGKPMIQHVTEQFPGVTDILFICKEDDITDDIRESLEGLGGSIVVLPHKQAPGCGPVDTLLEIKDHIADDKEVIISYCDHGMVWDFNSFLKQARDGSYAGSMTCYKKFHPHMLGTKNLYTFCLGNTDLYLVEDKQEFTEERKDQFVSSDVFYFKTGNLLKTYLNKATGNPSMNGFIALVYNLLLEDDLDVCIHEVERMLLWATPEDLDTYNRWSKYFKKKSAVQQYPQDFTMIVPMCGKGTRFAKAGYELPKPLLLVGDSPMFVGVVESLPRHKDNVFVCSQDHDVEDTILSQYPNAKVKSIDYVTEGFAESCELAIEMIDEDSPIVISPCDNGVGYNEEEFLKLVSDETNDVVFWVTTGSQAPKVNPSMYTWVYVNEEDQVLDMVYKERPTTDLQTTPVSIGIMYFRKAKYLLEGLRKNREQGMRPTGELCMDSVAHQLAMSDYKVKVFNVEHYACWGTPDDYKTDEFWRSHFA